MKKFILLIMGLVLTFQCFAQNADFDVNKVKNALSDIKRFKDIVISQAEQNGQATRDEVEPIIDEVSQHIQFIIDNYDTLKNDEQLQSELYVLTYGFLTNYIDAITVSKNDRNISIGSRKFVDVLDEYNPKFNKFYDKANEYIKTQTKSTDNDNEDIADGSSEESSASMEQKFIPEIKPIWVWISLGIGAFGFIIGICALICIASVNARVLSSQEEIYNLNKDFTKKINDLKLSSYVGVSQRSEQGYPRHGYQPQDTYLHRDGHSHKYDKEEHNPTPAPPPKPAPTPTPVVEDKPSTTYLYATVKASSGFPEFSKIANENSGDKVFQLILSKPEDEIAEFTIVPNMPADFKKEVIFNRETFLPAMFCEKSIDNANPREIEILSKGLAKKIDGKWQVQDRMKIRLI